MSDGHEVKSGELRTMSLSDDFSLVFQDGQHALLRLFSNEKVCYCDMHLIILPIERQLCKMVTQDVHRMLSSVQ